MLVSACVPTTRYAYVPPSQEAVITANSGETIPLVQNSIALCWPDGTSRLVRNATVRNDQVCAEVRTPSRIRKDDGIECYDFDDIAGIGIPYASRSVSVIPMAAFKLSNCDPEALNRMRYE